MNTSSERPGVSPNPPLVFLAALLLAAPLLAGCLGGDEDADVLATFYPLEFITAAIAGDNVTVGMVVREGNEPHDWQPAPRDVARLDRSTLVVALGLGFEPWLDSTVHSLGAKAPMVVETSGSLDPDHSPWDHHDDDHDDDHAGGNATDDDHADGNTTDDDHGDDNATDDGNGTHIHEAGQSGSGHHDVLVQRLGTTSALDGSAGPALRAAPDHDDDEDDHDDHGDHGDAHGHDHGGVDPHIWLDPVLMAQQAEAVRDALVTAFPEHAGYFTARASILLDKLHDLHEAYDEGLEDCATRIFVTEHDAFSHLAARYDLDAQSVTGVDPESEADARRIDQVIHLVRDNGIPVVFGEQGGSSGSIRTVAEETGAEVKVLHTIEYRTPQERAAGADYLLLMYENLDRLREALGCR